MTTTKISELTLDTVKILSKNSSDKLTQTQVIARAVAAYAEEHNYLHTQVGFVTEGDTVRFEDGTEATIVTIYSDQVIFNDGTVAFKTGREVWRISKIVKRGDTTWR